MYKILIILTDCIIYFDEHTAKKAVSHMKNFDGTTWGHRMMEKQ